MKTHRPAPGNWLVRKKRKNGLRECNPVCRSFYMFLPERDKNKIGIFVIYGDQDAIHIPSESLPLPNFSLYQKSGVGDALCVKGGSMCLEESES